MIDRAGLTPISNSRLPAAAKAILHYLRVPISVLLAALANRGVVNVDGKDGYGTPDRIDPRDFCTFPPAGSHVPDAQVVTYRFDRSA